MSTGVLQEALITRWATFGLVMVLLVLCLLCVAACTVESWHSPLLREEKKHLRVVFSCREHRVMSLSFP